MRISIATKVSGDFEEVFRRFDITLFRKLTPPFVRINILRFDGCKKGDEVHIETNILGVRQKWISLITSQHSDENEIYFIDEGVLLPKPLKYWKHKHIIEKSIDSSIIIDDICYKSGSIFVDFLMFPALFLQFYYRKPVYKSCFSKRR
jgi:ligand-binding SRPBCC domain-containing protein